MAPYLSFTPAVRSKNGPLLSLAGTTWALITWALTSEEEKYRFQLLPS